MQSVAANAASSAIQAVNNPGTISGTSGTMSVQKDTTESSTSAKFGEVLQNIQSKYGAKAEKPREIKKTLGKDDFLRIMITQMRHQDPTNPFKAEQMATEMAQFTSVEQLQNLNQNMQKMSTQNQPLERLAMTNMIGKMVTVDRDRFAHIEGQNEVLSYHIPRAASEVKLVVINESGEVVLDKDIGAQKQGEGTYSWDGLKKGILPAKSGNYILRVEAKDENGVAMQSDSLRKVRVMGVSFEGGGDPILLVGDQRRQDKVGMKNIVRVESDLTGASAALGAASSSASAPLSGSESESNQPKGPNFISFRKGVGSSNLDPASASADVAQALAKYQESQKGRAQGPTDAAPSQIKAEGFPNGLHE